MIELDHRHSLDCFAAFTIQKSSRTSVPTLDLGRVPTVNSLGRFGKFSLHK